MEKGRSVVLRDVDGSFVSGVALEGGRLRVVESNVVPRGSILANPSPLPWEAAARDIGDCTMLSPHDLVETGEAGSKPARGRVRSPRPGKRN